VNINISTAVWCELVAPSAQCSIDVHLNYWRLSSGVGEDQASSDRATDDFLEVGIALKNPATAESIKIFLPIMEKEITISDCGPKFEEVSLAQAIFNTMLSLETRILKDKIQCTDLLDRNQNCLFRVFNFPRKIGESETHTNSVTTGSTFDPAYLRIERADDGTLFTIQRDAIQHAREGNGHPPADCIYFRLRFSLTPGGAKAFVREKKPTDAALFSGFDEVNYIDFRLNEARTLSREIDGAINAKDCPKAPINSVAFLTAVPVDRSLIASNPELHKMRLLEDKIWEQYARPHKVRDDMVVYHWKKMPASRDGEFSVFVKLQARNANTATILISIALAFALAISSNLFADQIPTAYKLCLAVLLILGSIGYVLFPRLFRRKK